MKNYYILRQPRFSVSVVIFTALILLSLRITQVAMDNVANLFVARQTLALDIVTEAPLPLTECKPTTMSTAQASVLSKGWMFRRNWAEAEVCLDVYLKRGRQSDLVLFAVTLLAARHGRWTEAVERITQVSQKNATVTQLLSAAYQLAATGNWAKAEINLRRAKAYLDALPLFAELFADGLDQLQLTRLRQRVKTPEEQLALATQYWRLARYDIAGSLSRNALAKSGELSARQRAWAWYIIAANFRQNGPEDKVLQAYQAGMVADPAFIANYWDALNWLASRPEVESHAGKRLEINLESMIPEGQLRQWTSDPPTLLGYTIIPSSELAPDGIYHIYLFWALDTPGVANTDVRRTSRWAIQRLQLRNQAALGHFDFDDLEGKVIPGWEEFLYAKELGKASIQFTPGTSGGALRLVPNGSNPIGLRGVPPLTGIPVQPQRPYLLTGRMRVTQNGVASIRCIWYTSTQEALELDGYGVPSYFETYNIEWVDSSVLLMAPDLARSCELRLVYGVGTGQGWFDDIRLFELPNIGGN